MRDEDILVFSALDHSRFMLDGQPYRVCFSARLFLVTMWQLTPTPFSMLPLPSKQAQTPPRRSPHKTSSPVWTTSAVTFKSQVT